MGSQEGQGRKTVDCIANEILSSQPGPAEDKGQWNKIWQYCPEVFQHHLRANILVELYLPILVQRKANEVL